MASTKNQRAVENRMREVLEADRARVQIGRISRFGLLEMSRQRLRPSLEDLTTEVCPRCSGQGRIRDTRSLALAILRVMEEDALKERSSMVRALVPLNIASYLLNEKRQEVAEIERRTGAHLVIVPNVNMETPQYDVQRIRDDQLQDENAVPSYELTEVGAPTPEFELPRETPPAPRQAVVQQIRPATPAPTPRASLDVPDTTPPVAAAAPVAAPPSPAQPGLFKRLAATLFGTGPAPASAAPAQATPAPAAPTAAPQGSRSNEPRGRTRSNESSARVSTPRAPGEQRADAGPADGDREGRGRRRSGRGRGGEARVEEASAAGNGDQTAREDSRRGRRGGAGRRNGEGRTGTRADEAAPRVTAPAETSAEPTTESRAPAGEAPNGGSRRRRGGRDRDRAASEAPAPAAAEVISLEDRRPSPDVLAASKRLPKRDRSTLDDSSGAPVRPRTPEPVAAQGAIATEADSGIAVAAVAAAAATMTTTAREEVEVAGVAATVSPADIAPAPASFEPAEAVAMAAESPLVSEQPAAAAEPAPETVVAEAPATHAEAPAAAEPEAAATADRSNASEASEAPATTPATPARPARAYNDPREVRRRQREAELKAQGILPRSGNQS
jgi:ribonuclease E